MKNGNTRNPNVRRRKARKFAKGDKAVGICDRTGFKHLLRDMVVEPGTGLLVHKSWSDGRWNKVDHPQNFPADTTESIGLENPRPDITTSAPNFLEDEDGLFILGEDGLPIFV